MFLVILGMCHLVGERPSERHWNDLLNIYIYVYIYIYIYLQVEKHLEQISSQITPGIMSLRARGSSPCCATNARAQKMFGDRAIL